LWIWEGARKGRKGQVEKGERATCREVNSSFNTHKKQQRGGKTVVEKRGIDSLGVAKRKQDAG